MQIPTNLQHHPIDDPNGTINLPFRQAVTEYKNQQTPPQYIGIFIKTTTISCGQIRVIFHSVTAWRPYFFGNSKYHE